VAATNFAAAFMRASSGSQFSLGGRGESLSGGEAASDIAAAFFLGGRGEALSGGENASHFAAATEQSASLHTLRMLGTAGVGGGVRQGGLGGSVFEGERDGWCWSVPADAGLLLVSTSDCGDSAGNPEKRKRSQRCCRPLHKEVTNGSEWWVRPVAPLIDVDTARHRPPRAGGVDVCKTFVEIALSLCRELDEDEDSNDDDAVATAQKSVLASFTSPLPAAMYSPSLKRASLLCASSDATLASC